MLIAFVPVLHKGYLELFKQYPGTLGILGPDIIADYTSLTRRDLRVIDPNELKLAVEALGLFSNVQVLSKNDLTRLAADTEPVVMPDEDVSRDLSDKYFNGRVTFAPFHLRLRWDKQITTKENQITPDRQISNQEFDQELMRQAWVEADKSADWWRQVGAIFVKDGRIIAQDHNRHLPSDFHLLQNGDPRSNFDAGVRIDLSTSMHAEARIIATSAKSGTSLDGCVAYVTTFPCPNCARLLAEAGIKKVYYQKGYSLLDAEEILKAYGVEIVLVT